MSVALSFEGERNCLLFWEWYLLLLFSVVTVLLYVRWFNSGLRQFSPQHFYAIVAAFWILSVIIGGLVVYREIDEFTDSLSTIMFATGSTLCILSMICLSKVKPPQKQIRDNTGPPTQELLPKSSKYTRL